MEIIVVKDRVSCGAGVEDVHAECASAWKQIAIHTELTECAQGMVENGQVVTDMSGSRRLGNEPSRRDFDRRLKTKRANDARLLAHVLLSLLGGTRVTLRAMCHRELFGRG